MSRENVEIVERRMAVFAERGDEVTRALGDAEVEFHKPPEQAGARVPWGIDEVVEFLAEVESARLS